MDEKKRLEEGGADNRADSTRTPGHDFLEDRLKRLEKKRRSAICKRVSPNAAKPDAGRPQREEEPGVFGGYEHPADSGDRSTPFFSDADSGGTSPALIGRDIPLTREGEDFLREQSFGPICGLYLMNGVLWPFLLPLTLGLIPLAQLELPAWATGVAALVCLFCPAALAAVCFHVGLLLLNRPWDLAVSLPATGDEPSVAAGYFYIGAGWLILTYVLVLGRWSRRMRWKGLRWSGFETFYRAEGLWCTLGGFLAVPAAAMIFGVLALGGLDRLGEWLQEFYYIYF